MKFGPVALADAEGCILAHSVALDGRRLAKGIRLSTSDIEAARRAGLQSLVAARLETGDIHEDAAAQAVAAALRGDGLVAEAPVHGRVNLAAEADGLLLVDAAMVHALNQVDEAVTLATLAPGARVARGDIAATIKIIPFAAPELGVATCRDIAAAAPLRLAALQPRRVRLVQTQLPGTSVKMLDKTAEVMRRRAEALGLAEWSEQRVAHAEAEVAAALRHPADIILVAGASAITDRRDVVPAAIVAAGGVVERLGMPVEPGNLICIGHIGAATIVGLPGCARSPRRNGVDWVLERLFAGLSVSSSDIAAMGVGGLLADVPRPEPRRTAPASGPVGAIVLAAGRSVRMGANKLLADLGGRPVLAHVLSAVRAAGLPAIVVTGHEAERVEALAEGPVVRAERYAEGLSQTLAAGVRAAPADWSAALIVLGDMPEITPGDLCALAAAAGESRIVVPTHAGKRGNPVAWGRRYFARLGAIEGDVGGKALMAEYADAIVEVAASEGVLHDVDTPEALAAARARRTAPQSS